MEWDEYIGICSKKILRIFIRKKMWKWTFLIQLFFQIFIIALVEFLRYYYKSNVIIYFRGSFMQW